MHKKIFLLLIQSLCFSLWAQELTLGQFKEHLPYNKFSFVAQDTKNIYAATNQSILVVDKSDGSLDKWSKLNGLSEVGIQTLFADQKGRLVIAYTNSNIDIIQEYKVHNIRDILNKQISGSKTINNICVYGDLAYLSCDFGVVIIDLNTYLVKDSWFTVKENEPYIARFLTKHNNSYFLATNKGVFSLPVSASNPADFSIWRQESELSKASFKLLCSYRDKLYAVCEEEANKGTLFVYKDFHWKKDVSMGMYYYRNFEVKNNKMLVSDWNQVKIFTGDHVVQYSWDPIPPLKYQNGYFATFDDENIWVADMGSGLIHINTEENTNRLITAEGTASSGAYSLCFTDGILAVVPGARTTAPNWSAPAISVLQDDKWWCYTNFLQHNGRATGFNSVAINPKNKNEIYIASWNEGLVKIDKEKNELNFYNGKNSILIPSRDTTTIFLSGLAFDKQNNLWMAQTEVSKCIKVKEQGTDNWYEYDLTPHVSSAKPMAEHILIDSRNYKWVTVPRDNKLVVFRGSASQIEKPKYEYGVDLTSQANVKATRITCIAEDREGRIWTGSDQGIKVIYDAASVFNRKVYAKNILIEQGEYSQNLFEFEYVTCIAVDAADRKWVGTRTAGVFLISPTGTQELLHFTTDNSPLFSNQINDIKINPENGEVFIATEGGLISYKGTATTGKENYKEVLVYPNPVRDDYNGPIAVKGLMEDSFCKITDAAGNLMWQGYAYGGQLIWNGKDFHGNRPPTGVYFVMASSKSGKEKKVAKLLFIQ